VVPPNEVGVKFDDIGALEDVKNTLKELVTLPMRRPELFRHGNLLSVSLYLLL
jgi:SpoVK/Ycf46/Vps4 family AAA+-type ATPase